MKQKSFAIAILLLVCISFSYAADRNQNVKIISPDENLNQSEDMSVNDQIFPFNIQEKKDIDRTNSHQSFFKKRVTRLLEKFNLKYLLAPQKIMALMIVGFLIMLPGMILAAIGVALIPAIILTVVGATLLIIGLLVGK